MEKDESIDTAFSEKIISATGSHSHRGNRSIHQLLQDREHRGKQGRNTREGFTPRDKTNITQRFVPRNNGRVFDDYVHHRIFCGSISPDGQVFMAACQDRRIMFYDLKTEKKLKTVYAADNGWSILDTDFSPDQQWLLYSGWSRYASICNIWGEHQVHDHLEVGDDPDGNFCLFSVKFSPDSNEFVGGSNDRYVYVYDLNRKTLREKFRAHDDDINTVSFFEDSNNHLLLSAGDDALCKLWDRRIPKGKAAGIFVGHTAGVTHIDPKGDGRYFISNGKDHGIKLWDVRKMTSSTLTKKYSRTEDHDYRYVTRGVLG
eukprot:TRINITY_DN6026_c0_g1_i1.p1 TRINITY_DN6026_c0_g1~~TRINITY_DN6026_c0_g1_i1.p1  ORF type:complete len:339 (+),score=65.26 TRINITY_DN6026_c0_g1_i1:72-1019(+)